MQEGDSSSQTNLACDKEAGQLGKQYNIDMVRQYRAWIQILFGHDALEIILVDK